MNNIIPTQPQVGARNGDWVWDGCRWICDPDCDFDRDGRHFGPPVFSGPVNQPPWYPGANGGVSFGQVFPPNPVRGHLFWDGKTFWLFDGAAWVMIGGQSAGPPVTPPGTTFPPNPAPGEQFFDGTTLWIWDGNAWVPVAGTKTTISATAPPSPHPGDLWFDGTQLRVWSGTAWVLVGPGATVGPVPTTTQVFRIVSPDVPLGTNDTTAGHIVPIGTTPSIDTLNGWSSSTHKYTPNKAGVYAFFIAGAFGGGQTNSELALLWNDNGSWSGIANVNTIAAAGFATGPGTISSSLQAGGMMQMNGTTDFVRLWGWSDDGSIHANNNMAMLKIFLLP